MKEKFLPASLLDRIREEIDLVPLVRENVRVWERRSEWHGQCPFHAPRRRPPFRISQGNKRFHCLSCRAEGDAIAFVMRSRKVSFREAVEVLSARLVASQDPVLDVLERATRFYEQTLWEAPLAERAREQLRQRGITPETARAWRLGYAPSGWTALTDAMRAEGFSSSALESAGLSVRRPTGNGHYDRFRGRLMIPIRLAGKTIAFGGRLIDGRDDQPKYLNSPESTCFRKRETLFGLDESRAALAIGGQAVIVEGFFDAMTLHHAGIANAVAICGSAVSENHVASLVAAGAREVVLALDGDTAGRDAAARIAELSLRWRCAVRILQCPAEIDPDELVHREGADAFRARMSRAIAAPAFLIEIESRKLGANAGIEMRIAAVSKLATLFEASSVRFTNDVVERLSGLAGCSTASMNRFLGGRLRA